MARTSIGRTIVITHCEVIYVDTDDSMKTTTVDIYGDYDLKTAQRPALKKLLKTEGAVTAVSHTSFYGKMRLEEFAEYCSKSDFKEW